MVLSWALTEVVRYTFYATSLVGWEPAPLVWARYSTFFVLYPTGAGSEALVNFATLPISVASGGSWFSALPISQWDLYALLRAVLFVGWWPGGYSILLLPTFFPASSPPLCFSLFRALCYPILTEKGRCPLLFRFVSDVYAYDEATPQGVWRAETGRQTQDDLTRTLWRIEIN